MSAENSTHAPAAIRGGSVAILILILCWSGGIALTRWDEIANLSLPLADMVLWILSGGAMTVVVAWIGFGAVLWAMARGLQHPIRLRLAWAAIAVSSPPLWAAAPLLAFYERGASVAIESITVLLILSLYGLFLWLLQRRLAREIPMRQSVLCLGLAHIFMISMFYLMR